MRRTFSRMLCAAMAVWFGLGSALPVFAAVLTGRRDVMTRQAPSTASNHEIRFITPTGVDSPTDTITIDFPIGFDLSTIVFGDIDLYHGAVTGFETSETIAASPAAGVWGAAVSGRKLTLTAPTDAAAGEISSSDIVYVRIGTNAAGGANQIVNPTGGSGPVTISIGGTFGDVGGIEVFIGSGDTVSISAVVAAAASTSTPPGPGGGGGGGPGVDGTPPIISNVQVINITTSTATVIWQTDEPASSRVDYGTTIAYGGVATSSGFVISHSVPLRFLPTDTLIHFKVTSADVVGNTAMTGDFTFHTLPPPVAPIISNVHVIAITDTSAVVAWDTDIPANSLVQYGLTNAYGSNASNGANVTSHNVSLFGLTEGTLYHFRVQSSEPSAGITAISGDFTFVTTADMTAPANVSGFTATPGDHHNDLDWNNPSDPDFSFVRIRARTDGYPTGPNDGRLVYQGSGSSMTDSGLVNGTTYFYANYAFDSHGNAASGAFAQATPFGTLPPVIPPPVTPPPTTPPTGPGGGGSTTTPPVVIPPGSSTTTPPVVIPPGSATTTPPIILPPPETPSSPGVTITPSYYGGAGGILLEPDSSGAIGILAGSSVLVRVPVTDLPSPVKSGIIRVGNSVYALTPIPGGQEYGATFVPSRNAERVEATVQLTLEDGRVGSASVNFETKAYGRVLERPNVFSDLAPIEGATVTIYQSSNGAYTLWQGARYGQPNPYITKTTGVWGFNVRNGNYRIVVEKEGYEIQTKDFQVTNNVASFDVILPAIITIPFIGPALEALQTEEARTTANITGPLIAVLAVANLAAAASLFSILNYLWFLLTQPILLLGRKRRDKWGIVYNSLTKQPVELAAVRLINVQTRAIVQTRISDAQGRFAFTVKPGTYRLEVVKQGYTYPTALLKDQKEDGDFLDVYHGEEITVKEDANIAVNIPLDPDVKMETPNSVIFKAYLRRFQTVFASLGVIVSLVALIIAPSWWMAVLLVFQILTFVLFWRLAKPKKPKTWGIVYNSGNRKPEGTTVVRIFDKKFNKLLETQVSNSKGQYGFIASKNTYFITAEKPGFEKYRSEDIDLTNAKEAVIDKHVPLKVKTK